MHALVPFVFLAAVLGLMLLHWRRPSARAWVWKAELGIAAFMFAVGAWLQLVWAPPEDKMGDVARIMYVHVPQVWMALIALTLNVGCSFAWLFRPSWALDSMAEAAAEVGVFFGTVGVVLGAIWGRPTWGVYWTWDARLTSAAVMIVIYSGYLAFRRMVDDPEKRARWSAVLGIIAFADIFLLWFSVKWFKTLHQVQSSPKTVDPDIALVLRWSATAFLALMFVFLYQRYRMAQDTRALELAGPDGQGEVPA